MNKNKIKRFFCAESGVTSSSARSYAQAIIADMNLRASYNPFQEINQPHKIIADMNLRASYNLP